MSYENQEFTEHQLHHNKQKGCEMCYEKELNILKDWFLKDWISHMEFKRLTGTSDF
jgi:hypothetical protein